MPNELISVYIPTRDRAELLERAIDSVLAQTYENVEIIVCDDASTDSTPELLARYSEAHKNIVCLRNEEPLGACASRNRAISAARGHFITGLDDDDEFLPNRIQCFLEHYDPRWSCLSALTVSFRSTGEAHFILRRTRVVTLDDMLYFNYLGNQIFCRTEYLKELSGFDREYPAWQDYELWTRFIRHYGEALRIGHHTLRIHTDHGRPRISTGNGIDRASDLYRKRHSDVMSNAHRRAQRFFLAINDPQLGEPRFRDLLSLMGTPVAREALGAYLHWKHPKAVHRFSVLRHRILHPASTP